MLKYAPLQFRILSTWYLTYVGQVQEITPPLKKARTQIPELVLLILYFIVLNVNEFFCLNVQRKLFKFNFLRPLFHQHFKVHQLFHLRHIFYLLILLYLLTLAFAVYSSSSLSLCCSSYGEHKNVFTYKLFQSICIHIF